MDTEGVEIPAFIANAIRAEARRLGVSEEELVSRAVTEFKIKQRRQLLLGYVKHPQALFIHGGIKYLLELIVLGRRKPVEQPASSA